MERGQLTQEWLGDGEWAENVELSKKHNLTTLMKDTLHAQYDDNLYISFIPQTGCKKNTYAGCMNEAFHIAWLSRLFISVYKNTSQSFTNPSPKQLFFTFYLHEKLFLLRPSCHKRDEKKSPKLFFFLFSELCNTVVARSGSMIS